MQTVARLIKRITIKPSTICIVWNQAQDQYVWLLSVQMKIGNPMNMEDVYPKVTHNQSRNCATMSNMVSQKPKIAHQQYRTAINVKEPAMTALGRIGNLFLAQRDTEFRATNA